MFNRIYRLLGLKSMDMNLFKVDMELPTKFDIHKIPSYAWNRYESKLLELANEALNILCEYPFADLVLIKEPLPIE